MRTVTAILIACRCLVLCFGLTVVASGCGNSSDTSNPNPQDQMKQLEDSKKAMEANSAQNKK